MNKEQTFFNALRDIFVGAKVEGESGFVNLMRIKSRYYMQGVFPRLKQDINEALKPFPEFREELFDRLYTFFRRYFSESGSIYFRFTPPHEHVYEKIYTDDRDVMLFWKTHMLYYVKTDRLFQSMRVEVDSFTFYFDVSTLQHKRANEKRTLVYTFKERKEDGTLVFTVDYSEKGRQTNIDDIRRAIRDALGLARYTPDAPSEETLERAFRLFERQSEVDYFINKNARKFLQEQLDLWLYQYIFEPEQRNGTLWNETRIRQLQVLKEIAYKIIDFIAQFEDELVRIWNKPRFALESHYVITLDRIVAQKGGWEVLERLFAHPNMEKQIEEWRELGMVGEEFTLEDLLIPPVEAASQPNLFEIAEARHLITTGYHLPYNPELVERARELRKHMTPAERKLWEYLRRFPYRVLRQRPIDHFIVDFYCPALKLVIEVDGEQHYTEQGKAADAERDTILRSYGLRVLRFRNGEVLNDFDAVCQRIERELESFFAGNESPLAHALSPLSKGGEGSGSGGIVADAPHEPLATPTGEGARHESSLAHALSPLSKGGEGSGSGGMLHPRYQYLPVDTRYFPDLEMAILSLFDHLDQQLDGWLVHSENYQALNTMLPKFQERVKCIHIDPPYNTETSGFLYANRYQHATWLTMMQNRIAIALCMLEKEGHFLCHIDDNEYSRLHLMFDEFKISDAGTIIWDKRNPMTAGRGVAIQHEYVIWRSNTDKPIYERNREILQMLQAAKAITEKYGGVTEEAKKEFDRWVKKNPYLSGGLKAYCHLDENGKIYQTVSLRSPEPRTDPKFFQPLIHPRTGKPCPVPPNGFSRTPETLKAMLERGEIVFGTDESTQPRQKRFLSEESRMQIRSVLADARRGKGDTDALGLKTFPYSHPVSLYEELIAAATNSNEASEAIVLDFFAGSGTTAHAVVNLNREDGGRRRYILVEMADYFHDVLLPRIKKVVFSDKWRDGKAQPDGKGISHFVKYFRLEQYEEILRRAHYEDDDRVLFYQEDPYTQYVFLRDPKMLNNAETGERVMEVDPEKDAVRVDLRRLYPNIDLAETLSCLTGKWIRRLYSDEAEIPKPAKVQFEDGTEVDLQNPPWEMVKPLIWW